MKGTGSKNAWALFLLILTGIVLGGFIGMLAEGVPALSWLAYGQSFGLDEPIILNLGLLVVTFGLTIKITIASIIGVILAIIIYKVDIAACNKDYPFVRKGQTYEHKKQLYTHRKNEYRFTSL